MNFWKRKLAAYLHDPPSKAIDIAGHREHAECLYRQAGFNAVEAGAYGEEFAKPSDWTAAAADRIPFPASQAAGLRCAFDGVRNCFVHPLGPPSGTDQPLGLPFQGPFLSTDAAHETDQVIQPCLTDNDLAGFSEDHAWRARFFAHWRFWSRNAVARDSRFALLPADTRIPDHTIWNHMQVVSALDACAEGTGADAVLTPAFLKIKLGPVQSFIAAARSTRDLWSGSYLLSWLMAAGLKALSAEVGPDAILFPSLRDQPLFDLHWRAELWRQIRFGDRSAWESLGHDADRRVLLTPNLPNVLLAVVPAGRAAELARLVEKAIRGEWKRIADAVWTYCDEARNATGERLTDDEGRHLTHAQRESRFRHQVGQFLSITWQTTPWPRSLSEALNLADNFEEGTPAQAAARRVRTIVDLAETKMPAAHRDGRFFERDEKGRIRTDEHGRAKLNNLGLGWSVVVALNDWQLDAIRRTQSFQGWAAGGWQTGTASNKDSLTGREEAIAGGEVWTDRCQTAGGAWGSLFKAKRHDWLGAATLIKRVWHLAYLAKAPWNLPTDAKRFPMPSTSDIASHNPNPKVEGDDSDEPEGGKERYFAVLALDGDEIGKWVSGEKCPRFGTQLAGYSDAGGSVSQGAKPYFADPANRQASLLESQRPLSPSYHLQFSETLSNFALLCARPIVEYFSGRLIYAGGDDVLALLPADIVLNCAQALRAAFRGDPDLDHLLRAADEAMAPEGHVSTDSARDLDSILKVAAPGFLSSAQLGRDSNGRPIPFIVPGPAADCSVGIAIAHYGNPLQDVVRAAQQAEKRAKAKAPRGLNRSAVAVSIFKRSGEINEWGCRWDSGGLALFQAIAEALRVEQLSLKFPHRVIELLEPYLCDLTGLSQTRPVEAFEQSTDEIVRREFGIACERQKGSRPQKDTAGQLLPLLNTYLASLGTDAAADEKLRAVIGLCRTVAFADRTSPDAQ